MKRILTFITLLVVMAIVATADESAVNFTFRRKTPKDNPTHIERAPMHLPIDVYYDDATRQFEVISDGEMDAQVYLCDENGATLDYAPCLNSTLTVPDGFSGVAVIIIDADNWEGRGETVI